MAIVLSRALKLPGKKSHDSREYDPLTQADSDESEDDLVINIQQNGIQNEKDTRDTTSELNSDGQGLPKKILQRQIDSKQDGLATMSGLEPSLKAASSFVSFVRTTFFFLTVISSMIIVLVCAFFISCPLSSHQNMWSLLIGYETEVSSPLELFDVDKDGVPDILLTVLLPRVNTSHDILNHQVNISALSGINGSVLWSRNPQESPRSIHCGQLILEPQQNDTCLLTGSNKLLSLVSASTGSTIWTLNSSYVLSEIMVAPAVILPDLDEDGTKDVLVLTIEENQPDLGFLLVSGLTGKPMGGIVKYNFMGNGKVLGPQIHFTNQGAIYILFGFGNIQAVPLKDIYAQAKNRDSFPSVLQKNEPDWEKRRSVDFPKLISVYGKGVEFLQAIPVFGSNCSDLLVTTKDGLSLLRGQDLEQRWSISLKHVYSIPQPGYFNSDENLDFFVQIWSNNNVKKVAVIDGSTSASLWEWDVPWHEKEDKALSLLTTDGKSVFLFWGEESTTNSSALHIKSEAPLNKHLYLLYPAYPGVILDLFNVSASVIASGVEIRELEKDALIAILTAEKGLGRHEQYRNLRVSKMGMRWTLSNSQVLSLEHVNMKPKVEDVKRILARLKFSSVPQRFL